MERRDDRDPGAPRGERRREPEDGREPTVHVHDVVAASPEHLLQSATQLPPGRNARDAAVRVDHAAGSDPTHEIGIRVVAHVRRDDGRGMPPGVELEGEVVHVLGNAPELGIVILGDQRDPHGAPV